MTENPPTEPERPQEPAAPSTDQPSQGPSQPSPWSAAGYGQQGQQGQQYYGGQQPSATTPGNDPGASSGPSGPAPGPSGPASGQQPALGHPGEQSTAYPGEQSTTYAGEQSTAYTGEQPTAAYGGYSPTGPHPTQQQPIGPPPMGPMGLPQQATGPGPKRGRTGLIAGVAALALVVGGLAGGLGGYLVAGHSGSTDYSSLDAPEPAKQAAAPAGSVQAVAQKVLPSVVEIAAVYPPTSAGAEGDTGSGIIISADGDILTNNHVIAGAASNGTLQVVLQNGKTVNASIVGRDPTSDLAVIKAQGLSGLPTAQLGRSDDLQVGQEVVAIGAPFQLPGTVTSGIVSSLHRATAASDGGDSQATVMDAIQTDAPINPGNSGGPLINAQGQVIGINSAIYSPSNGQQGQQSQGSNIGIGFAIPIDQAKRTADEIVKTGQATQTVLGVKVEDSTPAGSSQGQSILTNGALISGVTAGGPADKAGLKTGAIVVKADDRLITSSDDLVAAVHAASPGDQLKLTLSDGSTVTATLSGQPVAAN